MSNDIGGGIMGVVVNFLSATLGIISITNVLEAAITTFIGAFAGVAATHLFSYLLKKANKKWKK